MGHSSMCDHSLAEMFPLQYIGMRQLIIIKASCNLYSWYGVLGTMYSAICPPMYYITTSLICPECNT